MRSVFQTVMLAVVFIPTLALADWETDGRPALYSVPVPPKLEAFAIYPISHIGYSIEADGLLHLNYKLPVQLTGSQGNVIALSGPVPTSDLFTLESPTDFARCTRDRVRGKISCRVIYEGLSYDEVKRDQILKTEFADPVELEARKQVSILFRSEPVGIIEFEE